MATPVPFAQRLGGVGDSQRQQRHGRPPTIKPRPLGDKLQEIAARAPNYIFAFDAMADHVLRFLNGS